MNDLGAEDPRVVRRAALRRATLHLVLAVVAIDVVALGIYYLGGIEHGGTQAKQIFTWVWLVVTAVAVAFLLRRVRRIRYSR